MYTVQNPLSIQYATISPLFSEFVIPAATQTQIDAFNTRIDALYNVAIFNVDPQTWGWGYKAQYAVTLWILHLMKVDPMGQVLEERVDQISQSFAEFQDKKLTVYAVLYDQLRAANKRTFNFFGV